MGFKIVNGSIDYGAGKTWTIAFCDNSKKPVAVPVSNGRPPAGVLKSATVSSDAAIGYFKLIPLASMPGTKTCYFEIYINGNRYI